MIMGANSRKVILLDNLLQRMEWSDKNSNWKLPGNLSKDEVHAIGDAKKALEVLIDLKDALDSESDDIHADLQMAISRGLGRE
jgi:hypothetical protein